MTDAISPQTVKNPEEARGVSRKIVPSISLVQAVDDPALFASAVTLSPRQREPLQAIDDGARFVQLAWGRRSGKGLVQALIACWHALPRPEFAEFIRGDELRRILAIATNEKQARELILAAESLIAKSAVLAPMVESRTDFEIRFSHGVVFSAMPCSARGDRGRAASCVLLDEAAHHYDGQPDAAQSFERLFASVVPSVSQFRGLGTVVVASTPAGDSNRFAELRDEILENPSPARRFFHGASWEINPRIREEDLEDERRLLGSELYRQEFHADFLAGGGAFLSPDVIEDAVVERGDLSRVASLDWVVGADPAFSSDVFGCVVVGVDRDDSSRLLVGAVHGWEGQRTDSFEAERLRQDEIIARLVAVCVEYGARSVATDSHKARAIEARLAEHGIRVTEMPFTGDGRRQVFSTLRLKLDAGELELPRHPELLTELRALRVRYTGGGQTVEIPRVGRSHCDRAVALALAVAAHEYERRHRPVAVQTVVPRQPAGWANPIDSWNPVDDW
jgi:hypothetical protein